MSKNPFVSAAIGFFISFFVFWLLNSILSGLNGLMPNLDELVLDFPKSDDFQFIVILLTPYWLLAALFGQHNVLNAKIANVLVMLFLLLIMIFKLISFGILPSALDSDCMIVKSDGILSIKSCKSNNVFVMIIYFSALISLLLSLGFRIFETRELAKSDV